MSQSVKIFVFLCLAFLVFITAKGELGTYMNFFSIGTGDKRLDGEEALATYGTASNPSVSQQIETTEGKISSGVKTAETVAQGLQTAQAAVETENTEQAANEITGGLDAIASSNFF